MRRRQEAGEGFLDRNERERGGDIALQSYADENLGGK